MVIRKVTKVAAQHIQPMTTSGGPRPVEVIEKREKGVDRKPKTDPRIGAGAASCGMTEAEYKEFMKEHGGK